MEAPAISTRGLTKQFGRQTALEALDLDVPSGSTFGLLGLAGAGKTTVIRLLTGLARPTAGTIEIRGARLRFGGRVDTRRGVGVVLQEPGLPDWMTGREVLALMADLAGLPAAEMAARIDGIAARLGLGDTLDRPLRGLPGTARQWLAVAQALVADPEILLLDAPFTPLDGQGRLTLVALLRELRGTKTILLASRDLGDAMELCDRVAILDGGRVVVESDVAGLLDRTPGIYVLETAGEDGGPAVEGLAARLRSERWVASVATAGSSLRVSVSDDARARRELLPAAVGTGLAVSGLRREPPSVAEIVQLSRQS